MFTLCLNYVLEHMDLMRDWVDIKVYREGKCMCNLCGEDCESVGHFLWSCLVYSERHAFLKNNLGKNLSI